MARVRILLVLTAIIVAAGLAATEASGSSPARVRAQTLTIASWGGAWTTATKAALGKPYTQATGSKVNYLDIGGGWEAKLKVQKAAGKIEWDMIDGAETGTFENLVKDGLLQKLPAALKAKIKAVSLPGAVSDYGVSFGTVPIAIVCRPDLAKCPSNAREFWDVKNFPGKRGIPAFSNEALPIAALAAGSAPAKVYPINLDTAFAKLAEIKSDTVFTTSGDQMSQALRDGEVDMEYAWLGRIYDLKKNGFSAKIVHKDAVLEPSWLVIMKDAPNAAAAVEYLSQYALRADRQTNWTKALGYGTSNKNAGKNLPAAVKEFVPNGHTFTVENGQWFSANSAKIEKRWNAFLAG